MTERITCACTLNDNEEVVSLCGAHEEAFRKRRVWALNWLEEKVNGARIQWVNLPNLIKELRAILKY